MSELTRHAVKQIAQSKSLADDFMGVKHLLQIIDLTVFSESDMKKNIKARMQLSDGNSKITTMVPDKVFAQFVNKFSAIFRHSYRKNTTSLAFK